MYNLFLFVKGVCVIEFSMFTVVDNVLYKHGFQEIQYQNHKNKLSLRQGKVCICLSVSRHRPAPVGADPGHSDLDTDPDTPHIPGHHTLKTLGGA